MQRPTEVQVYALNCRPDGPSDGATPYIHSKYDLVAFTGGYGDGCRYPGFYDMEGNPSYVNTQQFAMEIKSYRPETIVLSKAGASPLHLYEDSPIEYFVMKDKSGTITQPADPQSASLQLDGTSFLYNQRGWLTFLEGDTFRYYAINGNQLEEVKQIDGNHSVGARILQPLEVFGYTPNLMPFNPLADYREVARLAVDQRYRGVTPEDMTYFDGVFYSEFRDRILCADEMCCSEAWDIGNWGADFDNDGVRDCTPDDTGQHSWEYLN